MRDFQQIEAYILGKLSSEAIDDLWIEFIRDPELYLMFETELMLRSKKEVLPL